MKRQTDNQTGYDDCNFLFGAIQSRVGEAAFPLSHCILGWKRRSFDWSVGRSVGFLFLPLCSMNENVITSTANGVGVGLTDADGRKGAKQFATIADAASSSTSIFSHLRISLSDVNDRLEQDFPQDLLSSFLRVHYNWMSPFCDSCNALGGSLERKFDTLLRYFRRPIHVDRLAEHPILRFLLA